MHFQSQCLYERQGNSLRALLPVNRWEGMDDGVDRVRAQAPVGPAQLCRERNSLIRLTRSWSRHPTRQH